MFAATLLTALTLTPAAVSAQAKKPASQKVTSQATAEKNTQLPVTRVALYKNGVGYFEHSGHVTGDQSVTIDFTTDQLNDVLQSLTAIDLNGGRISGAGYNSTTPLDQQLRSLSLGLGEKTTVSGLFTALRGSQVEVRGSGSPFTGRLVDIEMHKTGSGKDETGMTEGRFLTVASDTGAVRIFQLTPSLEVRLLDTALHTDLNHYLELLANNRSEGLRHLTLEDNGSGTRDLRVSYISEVPVWKSTYRILITDTPSATSPQTATLQGWAVVDNTVGTDWNNVQLSLIAGSPQSFIQPLSQPIYSRRPDIPIAQDAQLTPQTHESGEERAAPPPAPASAAMASMGNGSGSGLGSGSGGNFGGGAMRIGGVMGGMGGTSQSVMVAPTIEYQKLAADSLAPNTTTTAFDDYFEYKLTNPVTIRKNESALVPILQTKIDTERVTLWSPQQPLPLRALWITNTSNLTLDRGSFSIVENGSFGGEGLLDPIHPSERRLLSYAADQAIRVTTDYHNTSNHVTSISVSKGVLREKTTEVSEVEYLVRNAAPDSRTVIVEQPIFPGWKLDSDPQPVETTSTVYRFKVATQPRETVRLHIGQRRIYDQLYHLVNTSDDQLTLILRNASASPALVQQLQPIFTAKQNVTDLDHQIQSKNAAVNQIVEDQKRLRDNLSSLKGGTEERTLAKRYTAELNQQEDKLASLRKDLDALQQQREAAQHDLSNKIDSLNLNETI